MSHDLESAIEAARRILLDARPTLDQRSAALAVIEELDRAALTLRGAKAEPTALEREREGRVAAEASARRVEFLYEATSAIFASPLDAAGRLKKLASLVVPDLADWCLCDLLVENAVQRVVVSSWNDTHAELARSLEREYRLSATALGAISQVLATGKIQTVQDRKPGTETDELEIFFDTIGAKSWVSVPLSSSGRTLGALTFVFAESHRRYDASDIALAADLARRVALAIDNAVLVDKLERAVRARDDMVGVVSHDLRNPLSSIKMAATMLAEDATPGSREERNLAIVLRATDRLETLLRDLLDVTSLEAGAVTLNREPCSVEKVLADAVELIQQIANGAGVAVVASNESNAALMIEGDSDRLMQIFSNLLGNAVKFTPKGGAIAITAQDAGTMCLFSVADSGRGIAPEQLPHVFDRYWQGRDRARVRHGAGLGLAIAKGFVEAHGGTIDVTSVLGKGTTFRFTIPRSPS